MMTRVANAPPIGFSRGGRRRGSVLILVLVVVVVCLSLSGGIQQTLFRRNMAHRVADNEVKLRAALMLALQEGAALLAKDEDPAVDHAGEMWMRPRDYETSEGVRVRLFLVDAQDRFNVNHLTIPSRPGEVRGAWDVFEALSTAESAPDPERFRRVRMRLQGEELRFPAVETFLAWNEEEPLPVPVGLLTALPHPEKRWLPVNLNTVRPEVLRAMVGSSLDAWTDTVLNAREMEPIRNVGTQTRMFPASVRSALSSVFDVRSRYVELRAEAETDSTVKTLKALLERSREGGVEVVRCQW